MSEMNKGYTCACGKYHPFSAYVFAHWSVSLVNECECGRVNKIRRGIAKIGICPTKHAPDVVESAASSELVQAETESTSEAESKPATTQVM